MGGYHGVEHALIGLYPLISICDRNDLAGISTQAHHELGGPAVFIYDSYQGGLGLAESGIGMLDRLFKMTFHHVRDCPCRTGCPRCIQSPKCGAGNEPLDKEAVIVLFTSLNGQLKELDNMQKNIPFLPGKVSQDIDNVKTQKDENHLFHPVVFDIETQLSADEVGGWKNAHKMKIAVAVLQDLVAGEFEVYHEKDTPQLIRRLEHASKVIGFNSEGFDFKVLKGYSKALPPFKSLDLLQVIKQKLGHRLSLDQVASATLGSSKTADGLQSLIWWKEGRIDLITEYCKKDVEITGRIYKFGVEMGYILYRHRSGIEARVPVDW